MATVTFNEVTVHGMKSMKCAGGCGRTLQTLAEVLADPQSVQQERGGRVKNTRRDL